MPWIRAGSYAALPAGEVLEVLAGTGMYAVCKLDGEVHALGGTCPHRGGPLGMGRVEDGVLICPWHAWEFDCRTGADPLNPEVAVEKYPVRIEGDDIFIEVP